MGESTLIFAGPEVIDSLPLLGRIGDGKKMLIISHSFCHLHNNILPLTGLEQTKQMCPLEDTLITFVFVDGCATESTLREECRG